MIKSVQLCILVVISVMIVACVTMPVAGNMGDYLDSAAVTNTVKTKLTNKLGTEGSFIHVKTYRDEVQLTGVVNDRKTKHQAGLIAASVDNVKHVRNDLIIR